jgi:hypothetical protein
LELGVVCWLIKKNEGKFEIKPLTEKDISRKMSKLFIPEDIEIIDD